MLTKTRTTLITLAAAFSFGGVGIVPTVAQAAQNETAAHKTICDGYEDEFNASEEEAFNPELSGAEKEQARRNARKAAKTARGYGCDVDSWSVQPPSESTPTQGLRPEGEPKSAVGPSTPPPVRVIAPLPVIGAHA